MINWCTTADNLSSVPRRSVCLGSKWCATDFAGCLCSGPQCLDDACLAEAHLVCLLQLSAASPVETHSFTGKRAKLAELQKGGDSQQFGRFLEGCSVQRASWSKCIGLDSILGVQETASQKPISGVTACTDGLPSALPQSMHP